VKSLPESMLEVESPFYDNEQESEPVNRSKKECPTLKRTRDDAVSEDTSKRLKLNGSRSQR